MPDTEIERVLTSKGIDMTKYKLRSDSELPMEQQAINRQRVLWLNNEGFLRSERLKKEEEERKAREEQERVEAARQAKIAREKAKEAEVLAKLQRQQAREREKEEKLQKQKKLLEEREARKQSEAVAKVNHRFVSVSNHFSKITHLILIILSQEDKKMTGKRKKPESGTYECANPDCMVTCTDENGDGWMQCEPCGKWFCDKKSCMALLRRHEPKCLKLRSANQ